MFPAFVIFIDISSCYVLGPQFREAESYHVNVDFLFFFVLQSLLPLDEATSSRAVFVVGSGTDGRKDGRTETKTANKITRNLCEIDEKCQQGARNP